MVLSLNFLGVNRSFKVIVNALNEMGQGFGEEPNLSERDGDAMMVQKIS